MGQQASKQDGVTMTVKMTCNGCANAVKKALGNVNGVTEVQTDLDKQKVYVKGTASPQDCLKAVKGTGKECSLD